MAREFALNVERGSFDPSILVAPGSEIVAYCASIDSENDYTGMYFFHWALEPNGSVTFEFSEEVPVMTLEMEDGEIATVYLEGKTLVMGAAN